MPKGIKPVINNVIAETRQYGKTGESMNEIFMSGAEWELQKRLSRAGKNLDKKAKINNIISGIQGVLKELEDLK